MPITLPQDVSDPVRAPDSASCTPVVWCYKCQGYGYETYVAGKRNGFVTLAYTRCRICTGRGVVADPRGVETPAAVPNR